MDLRNDLKQIEAAKRDVYLQNMIQTLAIIFVAGNGGNYAIPQEEYEAVQKLVKEGLVFDFKDVDGILNVSLHAIKPENKPTVN